jgi:hypothetical protein
MINRIVTRRKNLLEIAEQIRGSEPDYILKVMGIESEEELLAHWNGLQEAVAAPLKIGFIGGGAELLLGTGKPPSLLNGDEQLPTQRFSTGLGAPKVNIKFFTQKDLECIEEESDRYKKELEQCKKIKDDAVAYREGSPFQKACFKLFQYIEEKEISRSHLTPTTLFAETIPDLQKKFSVFLQENKQLQPLLKSIHWHLPGNTFEIIEVPRKIDPIWTRACQVQKFLEQCDLIFLVVPANHFISENDLGLLDQIGEKLNGVRKIYTVASQIESLLIKRGGYDGEKTLLDALNHARRELGEELSRIATVLKTKNPETAWFCNLLIEDSRTLCVSECFREVLKKRQQVHPIPLEYDEQKCINQLLGSFSAGTPWEDLPISDEILHALSGETDIADVIRDTLDKRTQLLTEAKELFAREVEEKTNALQDALLKTVNRRLEYLDTLTLAEIEEVISDLENEELQKKLLDVLESKLTPWCSKSEYTPERTAYKRAANRDHRRIVRILDTQTEEPKEGSTNQEIIDWATRYWKVSKPEDMQSSKVYVGSLRNILSRYSNELVDRVKDMDVGDDSECFPDEEFSSGHEFKNALKTVEIGWIDIGDRLIVSVLNTVFNRKFLDMMNMSYLALPGGMKGNGPVLTPYAYRITSKALKYFRNLPDYISPMIDNVCERYIKWSREEAATKGSELLPRAYLKELKHLKNDLLQKDSAKQKYLSLVEDLKTV